jgi:type VI secretion system protein ImpA
MASDGSNGPTVMEVLPPETGVDRGGGPAPAAAAPAEPGLPTLDQAVAALCAPLSEADPCGPDLDFEDDAAYVNLFANVEGLLPTTFFSPEDGKPFEPSAIDNIDGQIASVKGLLARTRDIRLLALQARLLILNRNLAGFAANVAAIAEWLDRFWDTVHPRLQHGGLEGRAAVISTLDLPTVVFPLQYAPLFEDGRIGVVTYRKWMVTTGEARPRKGDPELAATAIADALVRADLAVLMGAHNQLALLKRSLQRIVMAFAVQGKSAGLNSLPPLVDRMLAFIDPYVAVAPTGEAGADAAGEDDELQQKKSSVSAANSTPASITEVAQALAAIADYYSHKEPSSPALPLVRQAHQLLGKSFLEVMTILVPSQVEKAAFQIGTDQVFELPLGKLSGLSSVASAVNGDEESAATCAPPRYRVESRADAIALLDLVQRYFRHCEPSSPVPMLCQRARALAERDFMGVLRDVLPKSALKTITADK